MYFSLLVLRFAVNEDQWKLSRSSRPAYLPAIASIVRSEGVTGLYQGVTPNIVGAAAAWGVGAMVEGQGF